MKKIIILKILCFVVHCCFAQNSGHITVKENFWKGTVYFEDNRSISKNDVALKLSSDKENLDRFNKGNSARTVGTIFGGLGGFLIGYPLGQSLTDKDPDWNLAIYGGVSTLLGAVIYVGGKRKIESAINNYNAGLAIYNDPDKMPGQIATYQMAPGYFVVNF